MPRPTPEPELEGMPPPETPDPTHRAQLRGATKGEVPATPPVGGDVVTFNGKGYVLDIVEKHKEGEEQPSELVYVIAVQSFRIRS